MISAAISAGLALPLFTIFLKDLKAGLALIGIIIFSRSGFSTFMRIPLGDLSDRIGRKTILPGYFWSDDKWTT